MKNRIQSLFFLFTAAIIWGLAFVAQCDTGTLGPFTFLASRSFLGTLTLIPVILLMERRPLFDAKGKSTIWYGALTGTVLFIASILQQIGINIDPNAGKAGFITGLYTVLVPVISFLLWRRKTGLHIWIGAALALVGLYFLTVTPGSSGIGISDLFLLIGSVFWAFHILTIDRFIDKVHPIRFSAVQFLTCGLWALLFGLALEQPTLSQLPSAWFAILFCGVLSSGVGYTSQILGQRNFDPTLASIILSTESLFSAIGGALFLQERMGLKGIIGAVLMFAGILISQLTKRTS